MIFLGWVMTAEMTHLLFHFRWALLFFFLVGLSNCSCACPHSYYKAFALTFQVGPRQLQMSLVREGVGPYNPSNRRQDNRHHVKLESTTSQSVRQAVAVAVPISKLLKRKTKKRSMLIKNSQVKTWASSNFFYTTNKQLFCSKFQAYPRIFFFSYFISFHFIKKEWFIVSILVPIQQLQAFDHIFYHLRMFNNDLSAYFFNKIPYQNSWGFLEHLIFINFMFFSQHLRILLT